MKKSKENKIYSFFPKSKSANVSASDFYANHLPTITQNSEPQSETDDDLKKENVILKSKVAEMEEKNDALNKANKKLRDDLTALKKLYNATCQSYVQKDLKVKLLAKKNVKSTHLFDSYKQVLGADTIKVLRRLDSSKRKDSTFVLRCMKKLCDNDEQLKNVRACGRKENTMLSPEKRKIIDEIFIERLANETTENTEFNERYVRLNGLINSAIHNMLRVSTVLFSEIIKFMSIN